MIRKYISEEDGDLVVNKKECLLIPQFKALFDRDKGSKNDLRGKHQIVACGELKYIYYKYDPRSEYFNTPESLSHTIIMDICNLPDNWKIDKVFDLAVDKYKELQRLSSAGSAYFSADAALFDIGLDTKELTDTTRELRQDLKSALRSVTKKNKVYTPEELELVTILTNKIESITTIQTKIITIINKMPELAKTIKLLKEQYSEEEDENNVLVGGRTLGNRES